LEVTDESSNEDEMILDLGGSASEFVEQEDIGDMEILSLSSEDEIVSVDELEIPDQDLSQDDDYIIEIDESDELREVEDISGLQMDPMLFQIYYGESCGHLQSIKNLFEKHESGEQRLDANKDLIRALHTLFGSARTAEIEAIAEICGATEKYVVAREDADDSFIPDDVVEIIAEVVSSTEAMLEELKAGRMPESNKALLDKINKVMQAELQQQLQYSSPLNETSPPDTTDELQIYEDLGSSATEPVVEDALYTYGDVDDDLIDIFLEEAEELLEDCESTLTRLHENEADANSINELQRHMHTLKGGARMATLVPVGDLTHVLESMVIALSENKIEASKAFFDVLHESLDTLSNLLGNVKQREALKSPGDLIGRIEAIIRGDAIELRAVERFDVEIEDLQVEEAEDELLLDEVISLDTEAKEDVISIEKIAVGSSEITEAPHRRKSDEKENQPHWGERATDVNFKESHEQVRVRADLLNNLVNYAGEVNIHHARMGKQITDIGFNLKELDQTVVRLKEQLRKLEIETEIQIRSSYEKEADDYDENFDPLEMDRYSTLQQLARSLSETASDVDSIKDILAEIASDSEMLLVQESRISTDLQEGLMRTRMVRFGGMSTRLRRIIRQTSRELGKEVDVEIVGEEQEVDRTILDRVVAPLEHMLRNAVAHGIELPKDRQAAGKSETGSIKITVGRQGTDVIVKVEDDGAGINADAIRKKAIKQGLLEKDNELTDHDVLQFILKSGFSTAEEVTQVA
ncbi:MAG: Hpt domain-containing protein, partial [Gammaproteobacteria bacterium]|nr:Hpt domain-containing protein [Gammaproteobacteria bacterium]